MLTILEPGVAACVRFFVCGLASNADSLGLQVQSLESQTLSAFHDHLDRLLQLHSCSWALGTKACLVQLLLLGRRTYVSSVLRTEWVHNKCAFKCTCRWRQQMHTSCACTRVPSTMHHAHAHDHDHAHDPARGHAGTHTLQKRNTCIQAVVLSTQHTMHMHRRLVLRSFCACAPRPTGHACQTHTDAQHNVETLFEQQVCLRRLMSHAPHCSASLDLNAHICLDTLPRIRKPVAGAAAAC